MSEENQEECKDCEQSFKDEIKTLNIALKHKTKEIAQLKTKIGELNKR